MTAPDNHERLNFGENLKLIPRRIVAPKSEAELLAAMREHRGSRIHAIGRLHSWSDAPQTPEVMVDLRALNDVTINEGAEPIAEIGAGCQIARVLEELNRRSFTLPALGLITEQAIAGAAATGTHGSGRHSLSHYIQSVRLACFDPQTGEPVIRTIDSGEELRAARCGLGLLGIVVSVRIPIRPQYHIEEHIRRLPDLESVVRAESDYPLQQFFLVPWLWAFFAQHRREADGPRSRSAGLYRAYWALGMDRGFHWIILTLVRTLPAFFTVRFFRRLLPLLIPQGWKVVDRSDRQLTMKHHLFRHIEIEIFVTRDRLPEAMSYIIWLLRHAGGESVACAADIQSRCTAAGLWPGVETLRGKYLHHYPICVRKVLADDTLISMAAGDSDWYAISFISYATPEARDGFFAFADVLARTTAALFSARPHWGKYCPLPPTQLRDLYPNWERFNQIRGTCDPHNSFGNAWLDEVSAEGR